MLLGVMRLLPIFGCPTTPVTLATNSWAPSVSATADTTLGGLNLSFTPPSGNADTIHVVARVESVEVQ